MRPHRHIAVVLICAVAAVVAAGCGEDTANDVGSQAEAQGIDVSGAARQTRDLAEQLTKSAQTLAEDPNADVDQSLADTEQQANQLADELSNSAEDSDASSALQAANERVAAAARELQDASGSQEVGDAAASALSDVDERLRDAAEQLDGADADALREQLDQARQAAQDLRDRLPSLSD